MYTGHSLLRGHLTYHMEGTRNLRLHTYSHLPQRVSAKNPSSHQQFHYTKYPFSLLFIR